MALQNFVINLFKIKCLLFIIGLTTVSGENGILSSLYRKAVKDNRPLILVLDNDSYDKQGQSQKLSDDSNESPSLYQLLTQSLGNKKGKKPAKVLRQEPKNTVPSVIKKLLRISNDLRCAAKDECQEECPKKEEEPKCEQKCEQKFQCDEPKEDECPDNECDEPKENDDCDACGKS